MTVLYQLNENIFDFMLDLHDYIVYRMDRYTNTSTHLKGKSVFINIKRDKFVSFRLSITNITIEQILVSLKSYNNLNLIVGVCQIIQPNSHLPTLITYQLLTKSTVDPNKRFIFTGDFNLPNVTFRINCDGLVFYSLHSDRANDL